MPPPRKKICLLGATGSIGRSTLKVIEDFPEEFEAVGLAAQTSEQPLFDVGRRLGVKHYCLTEPGSAEPPEGAHLFSGCRGLIELIDACQPELVVVATVGAVGLEPTLHAIDRGLTIALANKEVLVMAGRLVMERARRAGVSILPIDSEHNAIFQCLAGARDVPLRRIILTASGGPFRGRTWRELENVTVDEALMHPTWSMGPKITIDSATFMNKGFEVIEVHHLFDMAPEKIEVIVHPQSVIHSMIEHPDGSMIAQMGITDMYLPILNVLGYPKRLTNQRFERMNLAELGPLTFEPPDLDAFPCLAYAYQAIRAGRTYPTVLNAANEIGVERFLNREIRFVDIPRIIDGALQEHAYPSGDPDLEQILEADRRTRQWARRGVSVPNG